MKLHVFFLINRYLTKCEFTSLPLSGLKESNKQAISKKISAKFKSGTHWKVRGKKNEPILVRTYLTVTFLGQNLIVIFQTEIIILGKKFHHKNAIVKYTPTKLGLSTPYF